MSSLTERNSQLPLLQVIIQRRRNQTKLFRTTDCIIDYYYCKAEGRLKWSILEGAFTETLTNYPERRENIEDQQLKGPGYQHPPHYQDVSLSVVIIFLVNNNRNQVPTTVRLIMI